MEVVCHRTDPRLTVFFLTAVTCALLEDDFYNTVCKNENLINVTVFIRIRASGKAAFLWGGENFRF